MIKTIKKPTCMIIQGIIEQKLQYTPDGQFVYRNQHNISICEAYCVQLRITMKPVKSDCKNMHMHSMGYSL
jgi:hypothetical protein